MASAISSALEVVLRSDPAAVAAAAGEGGAGALRSSSNALSAIAAALERRAFELDCVTGSVFYWAEPCEHDNEVDHGSNMCSRTDSGTVCVGVGRAEIAISLENENVEGDETATVDCGVFSCEGRGAFSIDLKEAERILVEGCVEHFSRADGDDDARAAGDMVAFSATAPAPVREAAARSFVLALAEWLVEELGGEDEYGVSLGWSVADIAGTLRKSKKARKG